MAPVFQTTGRSGLLWCCRMCNVSACGRERGLCPAANAATSRFGATVTGIDRPSSGDNLGPTTVGVERE